MGIKDATGDLARIASLRLLIKKDFLFLSGEDATAVGFNAMGGNGIISVTSNLLPKLVSDLQKSCANFDYKTALEIQDKLTNFHATMFYETNPIPVKYGAFLMGLCENEIRLPLTLPSIELQQNIKNLIEKYI